MCLSKQRTGLAVDDVDGSLRDINSAAAVVSTAFQVPDGSAQDAVDGQLLKSRLDYRSTGRKEQYISSLSGKFQSYTCVVVLHPCAQYDRSQADSGANVASFPVTSLVAGKIN